MSTYDFTDAALDLLHEDDDVVVVFADDEDKLFWNVGRIELQAVARSDVNLKHISDSDLQVCLGYHPAVHHARHADLATHASAETRQGPADRGKHR